MSLPNSTIEKTLTLEYIYLVDVYLFKIRTVKLKEGLKYAPNKQLT